MRDFPDLQDDIPSPLISGRPCGKIQLDQVFSMAGDDDMESLQAARLITLGQ